MGVSLVRVQIFAIANTGPANTGPAKQALAKPGPAAREGAWRRFLREQELLRGRIPRILALNLGKVNRPPGIVTKPEQKKRIGKRKTKNEKRRKKRRNYRAGLPLTARERGLC
jgi:hypothetical protein